ncbi:hypothetical protein B0I35DRAFT_108670 [Stachybotrys elegans]|uniref:C2H2-type domain-containing protein n=1 Tax=Stachybotrys elegans TaxID=80388 RepID=A0A8K0SGH4_9HYPO|nr:hypothetical protein B0I35DRAFT_108670 [Stachybotrys elegans]
MSSRASSPDSDRAAASILELTQQCISLLEGCSASHQNGDNFTMETRLADLRLWADGVGATSKGSASLDWRFRSRPDDLLLVKTILIMLADFVEHYSTLLQEGQPTDDGVERIDSTIENLALIGVAIRRTGKGSRRRRTDNRFDPRDYEDLRRHLECIILLRPSKAGLQKELSLVGLTTVQKRLIEANLKRRHRFVIAQKRSRKPKDDTSQRNVSDHPSQGDASLKEEGQVVSQTSKSPRIRLKQGQHQRAPPTRGGLTAASTAEGTLQYGEKRRYIPGAARTQITALAADAEFPRPPPNPEGRRIGKCPCCCQSILVEDMMDPGKWRQHIIEDLLPYTCVIEECPAQTPLFSTRKEWEAHVEAEHGVQWRCPLCEENDLIFETEEGITHHLEAEHQDDVRELTLETLLPWSEIRRMGIASCPLCSSFGREDSPEIIHHVLRHVYEFSLRALPWTKPFKHPSAKPTGTYSLPKNKGAAERLVEWIDKAHCGTAMHLHLSTLEIDNEEMEAPETGDDTGYVPDDEYFDDESVGKSSRPQGPQSKPSRDSNSVRLPSSSEALDPISEQPTASGTSRDELDEDDDRGSGNRIPGSHDLLDLLKRNQSGLEESSNVIHSPVLPKPPEFDNTSVVSSLASSGLSHGTWSGMSAPKSESGANTHPPENAAENRRRRRIERRLQSGSEKSLNAIHSPGVPELPEFTDTSAGSSESSRGTWSGMSETKPESEANTHPPENAADNRRRRRIERRRQFELEAASESDAVGIFEREDDRNTNSSRPPEDLTASQHAYSPSRKSKGYSREGSVDTPIMGSSFSNLGDSEDDSQERLAAELAKLATEEAKESASITAEAAKPFPEGQDNVNLAGEEQHATGIVKLGTRRPRRAKREAAEAGQDDNEFQRTWRAAPEAKDTPTDEDSIADEHVPTSNRGMKLNEAKKLKREALAKLAAEEAEESARKTAEAAKLFLGGQDNVNLAGEEQDAAEIAERETRRAARRAARRAEREAAEADQDDDEARRARRAWRAAWRAEREAAEADQDDNEAQRARGARRAARRAEREAAGASQDAP